MQLLSVLEPSSGAIDSREIKKHRGDVFKLAATLTGEHTAQVPDSVKSDLRSFVALLNDEQPEVKGLLKSMGISTTFSSTELLVQIEHVFHL